jgi:hypothetical protein
MKSNLIHDNLAVMLFVINLPRHFLRLLAVTADDRELMLPLLAVPDGEPMAGSDGNADLAGVRRNFVKNRHGFYYLKLQRQNVAGSKLTIPSSGEAAHLGSPEGEWQPHPE